MSKLSYLSLLASTLLLAACVTPSPSNPTHTTTNTSQWQDLGSIRNNGILISYDKNSLHRVGHIATLRERKTILTPQPAFALENLPAFKTAEMVWSFHCSQHTFRLDHLILIDENNTIVATFNYPNTAQRYQDVPMGTVAERQFKLACAAR